MVFCYQFPYVVLCNIHLRDHFEPSFLPAGSPQKSSSVDMMITLLDINDNDPIFAGTPYKVNVLEEQPSGLNVIQVT